MFEVHHIKVMERSKNVWVFGGLKVVNPIYKKHITTTTAATATATTTATATATTTTTTTTTTTCLKSNSPICGKAVQHLQTRFARQEDAQVRQGVRWPKPQLGPHLAGQDAAATGDLDAHDRWPRWRHAKRWGLGVFELFLVEDI
jgi:hypothetical protein